MVEEVVLKPAQVENTRGLTSMQNSLPHSLTHSHHGPNPLAPRSRASEHAHIRAVDNANGDATL